MVRNPATGGRTPSLSQRRTPSDRFYTKWSTLKNSDFPIFQTVIPSPAMNRFAQSQAYIRAYRWYRSHNFRRAEEVELLIEWLDPRPGERILDIGCGDGLYSHQIASRGASVVGIDINQERLDVAHRWHSDHRAEFHSMDAAHLKLGEDSFDKAVSFCVIEHFENDGDVLGEIHRVLKPGSLFVFSADSLSSPELSDRERTRHQRRYAVNTFYDQEIIVEKLGAAGFELEDSRFILTSRVSLELMRFSWWLDRLPSSYFWLSVPGYVALGTLGRRLSSIADFLDGDDDHGLTLMVRARKP